MTQTQHNDTMPASHHNHPEAEERDPAPALPWKPKFRDKFDAMPDAWHPLILTAKKLQIDLGLSDGQFSGSIIAGSAWNQLYNGAYRMPTSARGVDSITKAISDLIKRGEMLMREQMQLRELADNRSIAERFVKRPELQDVHDALSEAAKRLRSHNEERNIAVVGPTRSGKSWLIAKLLDEQKVNWSFRAKPHMKRRYSSFLRGLAKALGKRDIDKLDIADLEESILAKLSEHPCTLAIEELQRFSKASLELLKTIMNETKATLIIFMKPKEYERMCNADDDDAQQFLGRTIVKIELHVTPQLVQSITRDAWKAPCPEGTAKLIAECAEKGGSLSLVREVVENATTFAGRSPIQREHVEKALAVYRRGVPELKAARQVFGIVKHRPIAA